MPEESSTNEMVKTSRLDLLICAGTGCVSNRSFQVRDALLEEIRKQGLSEEV